MSKIKDYYQDKWLMYALEHGRCMACGRTVALERFNAYDCMPDEEPVWKKIVRCFGCKRHQEFPDKLGKNVGNESWWEMD